MNPSRTTACLWLFALLSVGCGGEAAPSDSRPATPPEREPASEPASEPTAEATPAPEPAPTPALAIGYTTVPSIPSRASVATNRRALAAHRRRDYEASAAGFREALEQAPGNARYRFNLACALALSGDVAGAEEIVTALLLEDLPTHRRKLETDADVAALRTGEAGARIEAHIAAVEAVYRRAAREGVPVVAKVDRGTLRAGVYWPSQRRFVPLGVARARAFNAIADPERGVVMFVNRTPGYYEENLTLYADPLFGEGPARAEVRFDYYVQAAFYPTEEGARGRFLGEPMGVLHNMPWMNCVARRCARDESQSHPDRWHVRAGRLSPPGYHEMHGSWRDKIVGELHFRGNTLLIGEREIALPDGHAMRGSKSAIVDETRGVALIMSSDGASYLLERVTLADGTVTRVERGTGQGAMRDHASGAVFVQRGERIHRLPTIEASMDAAEPALEGVRLTWNGQED